MAYHMLKWHILLRERHIQKLNYSDFIILLLGCVVYLLSARVPYGHVEINQWIFPSTLLTATLMSEINNLSCSNSPGYLNIHSNIF